MSDLKAVEMYVHHWLIREIMLYKYELGHNAAEALKTIFVRKMKT